MLDVYNIKKVCSTNNELKILIIDSDRYEEDEKNALIKINKLLNENNYKCQYISWKDIKSFEDQLKIMNDTDIHVAGAGTSMLNFPFLCDNKIHINLGVCKINPSTKFKCEEVCEMPGLLEVNICLLSNNIFCDFYDIFKHKRILYKPVLELLFKNIYNLKNNINNKTQIPQYIKVWRDYCDADKDNMKNIIDRMCGIKIPRLINIRFPEMVVYNQPPYDKLVNIRLLKDIKDKYDIIDL